LLGVEQWCGQFRSPLVVTLESWIGSADPMAIGPFPQDPFHLEVRRVEGDVGVTHSMQDVDRGGMIRLPHHPAEAVKFLPHRTPKVSVSGSTCEV
jgi:hypothetical protein